MTASGHSDLPGGQRNAYADGVTGSGQLTVTGHAESGHGETGIDPRIESGLSMNESLHAATGSGQKTGHGESDLDDDRRRRSRPLDREREEERERERRRRPRELLVRDRALLSFRASRSEDREPREDSTRGRDSEVSLDSSHRRACGEERGETTEAVAREG